MDEATIAVALLHDTIEDTTATRAEIDELFGPDIGKLVEGLTKLKKLDLVSKKAEQAENLRKLLLAISEDVRVLLVKLADRLHNMRTLDHVPEDKRLRIAEETMEIYAPLAGRMGMQGMREELEELAFRYINPEAYRTVTERLAGIFERNRGVVGEIEKSLSDLFKKYGIKAEVKSRQKKPWSVFRKMEAKALSFEQLSDIFGFRVVVDTVEDCYRALGAIHTTWSMVPGRFKDYISTPKQNDYRSIHTTIVGPSRQRIELQIRTREMNNVAEYGVAVHALYKDNGGKANGAAHAISKETNAYAWLRRTIEQLAEGDNPEDFLENTKLELFQDQVFCFTPKGMLIALPRGATPIDFAYAVHTDVGDTCVGAKVNGRIMPLMTELKNGDEVEIIRSKAQVPPAAWESIVVTGKARAAIRRATKNAIRKQFSGLGVRILERAFERAGKTFTKDGLKPVLHRLARKDIEDVLAAVGRGELASSDVMRAVFPDFKDERVTQPHQPKPARRGLVQHAQRRRHAVPAARLGAAQQGQGGAEAKDGAVPIRGVARRPAGALRRGRRGAGRPHRRHRAAGIRHHHLSDPVAVAAGLRRPARALDRRALGHRREQQGAISGQDFGDRHQCAGFARRDRAGHRRQRRQHPHAVDDPHRAGFHRNADRPRSLGSEASEPAADAAQGQLQRQRCAARQRLNSADGHEHRAK